MAADPNATARTPNLEPSWLAVLEDEFQKPYMQALRAFLREEMQQRPIYPPGKEMFNAFWLTPFDHVKVVILGQDPYHGANQAHGLCFSVRHPVKPPPSLVNIFQEIKADLGIEPPNHGDLSAWATQGVLLLNTVLSVRAGAANSHRDKGWEIFTDRVIQVLSAQRERLVFVLWGAAAGKKAAMIDRHRHLILRSAHPSPYSADAGFFGCRHFSKINSYLQENGQAPIDWRLPAPQ
jgi:uracil-DNA glycosylase